MRRSILLALLAALLVVSSIVAAPSTVVVAKGTQVVVTITVEEINAFLVDVAKDDDILKLEARIIDGGIIMTVTTDFKDLPVWEEHYGVLIRDKAVVTEAGKFVIPGIGGLGFEDIQKLIPDLVPFLKNNARVLGRYVLRRIRLKAGSVYTPVSVTTGDGKVVIVVTR